MRFALGLLMTTALAGGAQAADYLRGMIAPPAYSIAPQQSSASFDWSGAYIGGTYNYNVGNFTNTFSGAGLARAAMPNLAITDQVQQMVNIANSTGHKTGFSIYGGYSTQWDDVVVSAEAEYTRANAVGYASVAPMARTLTAGNLWDVDITGGGRRSMLQDYGVIRGRVGAAYGRFLPFITAGLAYGRMQLTDTLTGSYQEYQQFPVYDPVTGAQIGFSRVVLGNGVVNYLKRSTKSVGGYAIGAGIDYAVTDNILLRGYWQMIQLGSDRTASVRMNSLKVGGAVKF